MSSISFSYILQDEVAAKVTTIAATILISYKQVFNGSNVLEPILHWIDFYGIDIGCMGISFKFVIILFQNL